MTRRALADYDWRGFADLLAERLHRVNNLAALAEEIGVSVTDLNRAVAAQIISAPKLIAICDWMQIAVRAFYLRPVTLQPHPEKSGGPGPDLRRMPV